MIGGFIISGTTPKRVLLRAIGPSLQTLGVDGALADPVLELHGPDGAVIATNDNWRDNADQAIQIQATGIPPKNDLESAIIATLSPAGYTAIVSGKDSGIGIGLVEAYDLDQAADSQLANISTRAFVQTGDDVAIGGFILGDDDNSSLIVIRALGPSLIQAGITNPLLDPVLELRDAQGVLVGFDDNWQDDTAQAAQLSEAGFGLSEDSEAAIIVTLPSGAYTTIVSGVAGTTGIGLAEIYNLQ
jgi:hypothetical protein